MLVDRTIFKLLRHNYSFLDRITTFDIILLHLGQVELLWTKNGARSSDSNPPDEWFGRNLVVLHGPETNKRSSSTKASFAVDSNGTTVWISKVVISDFHELFYYVIGRC